MNKQIVNLIRKKIAIFRDIHRVLDLYVPPGHFYSPIPSLDEIHQAAKKIWPAKLPDTLSGIDLNLDEQLDLFEQFITFYKDMPFQPTKVNGLRYYFENESYSYSDAIFLYCMMRKLKPKRIIEIGSGFTSGVMMDTNELFFNNKIEMTFIEPHPLLLISLMKENDKKQYRILPHRLQNCDLKGFELLQENDILFVDSTHVSKINSDVNLLFFEILPRLNKGVHIHFHDIFYPFEYLKEWVYEGVAWNEAYMLRVFLQYNSTFKILFFNTFLEYFFKERFETHMPLCLKNEGGSIWIKKC